MHNILEIFIFLTLLEKTEKFENVMIVTTATKICAPKYQNILTAYCYIKFLLLCVVFTLTIKYYIHKVYSNPDTQNIVHYH